MRLIVLTGLVAVEKLHLAAELADHYTATGDTVTIIDNVSRLTFEAVQSATVDVVRLEGDLSGQLLSMLRETRSSLVVLTVSETTPPDKLFLLLDDMQTHRPDLDVQTLALVDTRTCDCFPVVRETLEDYADATFHLPVTLAEVLGTLPELNQNAV